MRVLIAPQFHQYLVFQFFQCRHSNFEEYSQSSWKMNFLKTLCMGFKTFKPKQTYLLIQLFRILMCPHICAVICHCGFKFSFSFQVMMWSNFSRACLPSYNLLGECLFNSFACHCTGFLLFSCCVSINISIYFREKSFIHM